MGAEDPSGLIEVRRSEVHGLGVFALRPIARGTRVVEYVGERVSHAEADRRYESKDASDSHTFLFIVDSKTVIDAGVDGNEARFINHSCDPNCESVIEGRRIYIEAIRDVEPGSELTYDYQIQREDDDPDNVDEVFACHCGFAQCRGTMLWPTERKARRRKPKKDSGRRERAASKRSRVKSKSGALAKTRASGSKRTRSGGRRQRASGTRGGGRGQRVSGKRDGGRRQRTAGKRSGPRR